MQRIPMTNGDEYDALIRARRFFRWRPGERKRIKRAYRRRERQRGKAETLPKVDPKTYLFDVWE